MLVGAHAHSTLTGVRLGNFHSKAKFITVPATYLPLLPIVVMVLVMLLFLVGTAIVTSAIALRRARYRALRADTL